MFWNHFEFKVHRVLQYNGSAATVSVSYFHSSPRSPLPLLLSLSLSLTFSIPFQHQRISLKLLFCLPTILLSFLSLSLSLSLSFSLSLSLSRMSYSCGVPCFDRVHIRRNGSHCIHHSLVRPQWHADVGCWRESSRLGTTLCRCTHGLQ